MIKKAMILAAGFGKRIHPLTLKTPKPLLSIGKKTLLSNTIKFLELFGIEQVVINVHYLGDQIIDYINKNKFGLNINIIKEEDKILDTGGGVLNAIKFFSNEAFLIINSDTIWDSKYIEDLKSMQKIFFKLDTKCLLLVVNKKKSFDKSLKGDFSLKNNLIDKKAAGDLDYIYTGLQIVKPNIFSDINEKVFSINKIWDKLIKNNELHAIESKNDFLHVSNLDIYRNLKEKF